MEALIDARSDHIVSRLPPVPSALGLQTMGPPTVMIVEDEALIALNLEDAFLDGGYEVTGSFSTCADALACLAKTSPHLAIVDATLKDGSCLELARELRRRNVPFLIYSGTDALPEQPPELEGVVWVEKPAPASSVVRAAAGLLAR